MKVRYVDDGKQKHHSHEIHLEELDHVTSSGGHAFLVDFAAYGADKAEAVENAREIARALAAELTRFANGEVPIP